MTNPYCNNDPITKSRDCTEIEPKIAMEICKMFDYPFRDPLTPPESFIVKASQRYGLNPNQLTFIDNAMIVNKN